MRWLYRLFLRFRNRADGGLQHQSVKFGTKPIRAEWCDEDGKPVYDQAKAIASAQRARRQTETGRAIKRPKPCKPAEIVRPEFGRKERAQ